MRWRLVPCPGASRPTVTPSLGLEYEPAPAPDLVLYTDVLDPWTTIEEVMRLVQRLTRTAREQDAHADEKISSAAHAGAADHHVMEATSPNESERAMAKLLVTATYGYDNSTRAAMPFFVAKGAKEAGIDVGIVLALDAAVLVKPEVRKHVRPYGQPPLEELFQFSTDHKIPVYV